jgi:ABC-type glycerol-3-phosphate transport system substrate-binding protein
MDHMKKAGITKMVPESYAEWLDQLRKLKEAGFAAFNPGAGARNHFIRLYIQNLAEDVLYGEIDHAIDETDIGQPDGIVSLKEGAWATRKGLFSPKKHPAFADALSLIKDQVPYWPTDWLAPADTAAGDPWVKQAVSQDWNHGPWRVDILRADPEVTFEWGTFALPPITAESSSLGKGLQVRALGGSSGSYLRLDLPFMIPMTTVEKSRLPLVLDFLRWMISPENIQYWNENAKPKGWDPIKQKFEEVFTDPVLQRELYGHYVPNPRGKDGQSIIWDQFTDQGFQVADLYFADRITLDECLNQLEVIWNNNVEAQIQEHPEWKTEAW